MNGNAHDKAGLLTTSLIVGVSIYHGLPFIPIAAGSFCGFYWLSPDVDIRSNPVRRWGYLGFIWIPLQKWTKHRGITHHWLLGAPTVLSYLLVLIIGLVNGFRAVDSTFSDRIFVPWPPLEFLREHADWIAWFTLAVAFQHWVHLTLDWWGSRGKKNKKKGNRKKRR